MRRSLFLALIIALAGCESEEPGVMLGHKTSVVEGGHVTVIDLQNSITPFSIKVTDIMEISCPPGSLCLIVPYTVAVFEAAGQTFSLAPGAFTSFSYENETLGVTLIDIIPVSWSGNGSDKKAAVFVVKKVMNTM